VSLVSGPSHLAAPMGVKRVNVETAQEMLAAVEQAFADADALIMAAAVADYRPTEFVKTKKPKARGAFALNLELNPDIVATLAGQKGARQVVGFAAETGDAPAKALKKLRRKKLDAIVANDVGRKGIGFDTAENEVVVLFADGRTVPLPRMSKDRLAFAILETLFAKA
jgi:phosphopantothenoylcysteine decarboxylase/phosphopantothenate--cysteine ligase